MPVLFKCNADSDVGMGFNPRMSECHCDRCHEEWKLNDSKLLENTSQRHDREIDTEEKVGGSRGRKSIPSRETSMCKGTVAGGSMINMSQVGLEGLKY